MLPHSFAEAKTRRISIRFVSVGKTLLLLIYPTAVNHPSNHRCIDHARANTIHADILLGELELRAAMSLARLQRNSMTGTRRAQCSPLSTTGSLKDSIPPI